MTDIGTIVAAALILAAGTYAFRFAGPALRDRFTLSPRIERMMAISTVVLLAALVASAALVADGGFAGPARPAGVAVGGLLAWRKAPFVLVVIAAAATTAGLRLLGVP